MSRTYYNDCDPKAVAWLRVLIAEDLIPAGEVDDRSIVDVQPGDLRGFVQCHFFAGIGGWPYALRLAGWPDDRPVWTGSCPCQRHSSAARGRNVAPDRWPPFHQLLAASRPPVLFGEQVASARRWIDGVCDDLEALDYACGTAVLPAFSVGLDHARRRIFYVGHAHRDGESSVPIDGEVGGLSRGRGHAGSVVSANGLPGRMALLRGFGNAIVPEVAAAFIGAYLDVTTAASTDSRAAGPHSL